MKLVFATNNKHKLDEVRKITSRHPVEIVSLADIDCFDEIPETADTLKETPPEGPLYPGEVRNGLFCRRYRAGGGSLE